MNLNLFAPMNNLGTGLHAYNMAESLEALGHTIVLIPPYGGCTLSNPNVERWFASRGKFSAADPSLMIFDPEFLSRFSGNPRIGFAVFETNEFSAAALAAIKSCDWIFTPSKWGADVLRYWGIKHISVVPEGYDPEIYSRKDSDKFIKNSNEFVFATVGKFEERKGTAQLIRCFARTFQSEEVSLIIQAENPFALEESRRTMIKLIEDEEFTTFDGFRFRRGWQKIFLTAMDNSIESTFIRDEIYTRADCMVFPTKGEGWGLPILESLACGIPVIVGRWTAMEDYIHEDYPRELLLFKCNIQLAVDGVWFHGDRGSWQVPHDDEICDRMAYAFKNREIRYAKNFKTAVDYARGFTWENAARIAEREIARAIGRTMDF